MGVAGSMRMTPIVGRSAVVLCFATAVVAARLGADESVRPVTAEKIRHSIQRGTDFLLDHQNANGSWGSATNTKDLNIYAPVPGAHHAFRSAVTALCLAALVEQTPSQDPQVTRAIDRGEAWMLKHLPRLRRATPDALYNVWGHGYALTALAKLHRYRSADPDKQQALMELMRLQIKRLQDYESVDGGWGYYDLRYRARRPTSDSTSFTTATVLIGMHDAGAVGLELPDRLVQRAIDSIKRQQKPDFTYLYGEYLKYHPVQGINRVGGSLGRSQACNLALRRFGDPRITDQLIKSWLQRLIDRNGWLDMGRKRPIPHESHLQVAGYFYYYGHYYAALCLEALPPDERVKFQSPIAELMIQRQEKDGSWWDFPLYNYHQAYGTAFAVMTLLRCLPAQSASQP